MNKKQKILLLCIIVIISIGVLVIYKTKNKIDMSYGKIEYVQSTKDVMEGIPTVIMFRKPYSDECLEMERTFRQVYEEYSGKLNLVYYNIEDFGNDEVMRAVQNYNVNIAPTMIFIDKEGNPKYREEGILQKEDVINTLKELGINN